ncbi:ABC transporter ATP-binding protein [Pelagibacterium lacus]|uniref:ABC transporter ATP-binding protein n=1 Tax=Pelagibacterium lacus TaxID=2282655 RepID=A0A369W6J7_9HYPH|nr:ABC transporter ATP-binding protein [Pelagibacterium lacus]RDE08882.1 ABC transporter ATP-binding protein [Pelagibacterium lacus]
MFHSPSTVLPTLQVKGLGVNYLTRSRGFWARPRPISALDNISFDVRPGETLGLVGESGSGKTTAGRAILRRIEAASGQIIFKGTDITNLRGEKLRRLRSGMQLVLQDPYASLNPRMRILDAVAEPLIVHGLVKSPEAARDQVVELLDLVGLPADAATRFPHAFSGGQRQRIGIARALALKPDLVVADEPVSALDVSVRAQVVNLMQRLQEQLKLSYVFIAHDLSIVRHISHRVAILYAGRMVEIADRDSIYDRPRHPYTEALLSAVPVANPALQRKRERIACQGEVPDIANPRPGCRFASRCPLVTELCRGESPPLIEVASGHSVACWHRS